MKKFADIAIDVPVDNTFTYEVPEELSGAVSVGSRVLVPFGRRSKEGYVVGLRGDAGGVKGIKKIIRTLDFKPVFDHNKLVFLRRVSSYYLAPLGEVLALCAPPEAGVKGVLYAKAPPGAADTGLSGLEKKVFDAVCAASCEDGLRVGALKKTVPDKGAAGAIERLRKKGLVIIEERIIDSRQMTEEYFSVAAGAVPEDAETKLRRAPLRLKAFRYVMERGETPGKELRSAGITQAVLKALCKDGFFGKREAGKSGGAPHGVTPRQADHLPNPSQAEAIRVIGESIEKGAFATYLLHGVTGSGKTFVYLKAVECAVRLGKKALYLVPEIALTERAAGYLTGMFPGRVGVLHSGLPEARRRMEWGRVLDGSVDVVVGTRSALFSPLDGIGLIIVDEEHDPSYKQEEGVRYNARDTALFLGKAVGAAVVLGSATPSLESFQNACAGKFTLLTLKGRVEGGPMPEVELLDMKPEKGAVISARLKDLIGKTLEQGSQALIFLNRRGYSHFLVCRDCGISAKCLNCSVTLTVHKRARRLKCHYCDFSAPIPEACQGCGSYNLADPGAGTEKIEDEVRMLFPAARVARLDRDTASRKGAAKGIVDAVESGEVDILVGTQMVAKGHHFPRIALSGIISGDTALNVPDFRGAERTFQLISQAAGRAGRSGAPSRVIVQTLSPSHFAFRTAASHDYEAFFKEEAAAREDAFYPPFARLAAVSLECASEELAEEASSELAAAAGKLVEKSRGRITVLGPAPAIIEKVCGRWIRRMLVKSAEHTALNAFLLSLKAWFRSKKYTKISLIIDVDPVSTL